MPAVPENVEDVYELSPMQEGMLYDTLHAADATLYVEQLLCTIRGALDARRFAAAWQTVVDRHPVLRTAIIWEGLERPMQVVRRRVPVEIAEVDWRDLENGGHASALDALLSGDRDRGFALDRTPLMRVTLARVAGDRWQCLWTHPHLLLDGWSVPIVLQEVAAIYEALTQGAPPQLSSRRPYRDYIVWRRSLDAAAAEAAWRTALPGQIAPTPPPLAQPVPEGERKGLTLTTSLELSVDETQSVDAFARQQGLTLHTVLTGAWSLLLSACAGTDTVLFGTSVSGRPSGLSGADRMVGLFINSLPVLVRLPLERPVAEWLQSLQTQQGVLREHESTPLSAIQKWVGLTGRSPFDSLLVVVNYPVDAAVVIEGASLSLESVRGFERTSMPLTVFAVPGRQISLKLMSDSARYTADTLHLLARRLRTIVVNLTTDATRPLGAVPVSDALETTLGKWGSAVEAIPSLATHQLFEAHADASPASTAILYDDQTVAYGELESRANRLARYLQRAGLRAGQPVAVSIDRTADMVVTALAISKAGGTYVPVDPSLPPARIALMLDAVAAPFLITESHHLDDLPDGTWTAILLDRDRAAIEAERATRLDLEVDPASDAYIIFTSGSTGLPKGAAIPHVALVNLLLFMRRQPGLSAGDRMLAIATMSFDLAVLELFLPLASGAAIVVSDRTTATDGRRLQALLQRANVTVMQGTPSTWRLLLASGWDGLPRIKMLSGGEPLTAGLARALLAHGSSLWNLYGPTETTIYSTFHQVEPLYTTVRDAIEPVGRPMPNQPHYILDHALRPVPAGVTGEVYIGGLGVARGYVSRPDLTADRFVPDPFSAQPGARMYRSGDLARFRADGVMEFAGRVDFQVKIRGYRVELGEIEAALEQVPGVRECLVLARAAENHGDEHGEGAGDLRLVAYLRAPADEVDVPSARAALRQNLPDYMVPGAFVVLDEFPRLPNGKPDRSRLPAPGVQRPSLVVGFDPPTGAAEQTIARLWQETLNIERVGANDNFFDAGGHSLLAVGLLGKLRETFGRDIALVDLFTYPTVRAMAAHLLAAETEPAAAVAEADTSGGRSRLAARRARRQE